MLLRYFVFQNQPVKFSHFLQKHPRVLEVGFEVGLAEMMANEKPGATLAAYCLMPTHFHLLVRQDKDDGVSDLLRNIQNSYAKYFNAKYKRKEVLWCGPFKNVPIETDEQLLHITRYIHLNPTSAGLVKKPAQWMHSSYREYVTPEATQYRMTSQLSDTFALTIAQYKEFAIGEQDYQRELAIIKAQILE